MPAGPAPMMMASGEVAYFDIATIQSRSCVLSAWKPSCRPLTFIMECGTNGIGNPLGILVGAGLPTAYGNSSPFGVVTDSIKFRRINEEIK
jgi:hypothetical protein